jgi:hypothetical protein
MSETKNVVKVNYARNGRSVKNNDLGMREMQIRVYEARENQYLLIKAPPASGKSRALMFVALDKMNIQGLQKTIVAVPERSIGKSFSTTQLKKYGFYWDWVVEPKYNLCIVGGSEGTGKVQLFKQFITDKNATILVCTHATLRFAFDQIGAEAFNDCFVGIDEFHHVSADYESKLGELVRSLMSKSTAHIMAMTGSYFRGDGLPVLLPEDEAKFVNVTYNYYEQLNGYQYLKSLGISFHFYSGKYTSAISEVLNTGKKTIVYLPNVNGGEALGDKYLEVDAILDTIGTFVSIEHETNIMTLETQNGKLVKVADLVTEENRDKVVSYLSRVTSLDDIDIIIALGMAKEGFDWPFCEETLTIGYRGSLTEIVQIIGRCTRDSNNKTHAQFTNLIAEPDASRDEITESVNNMLKAISASLLMEQVVAPKLFFKPKGEGEPGAIEIGGLRRPSSLRTRNILTNDLTELKAAVLQDEAIQKALTGNAIDTNVVNKVMIPKIIMTRYPDLNADEIEEVRENLITDMVLRGSQIVEKNNKKFITLADSFINIEDIDIDLINRINPFQQAFEILSKDIDPRVLKAIQTCIRAYKISMTEDEAFLLWPKINDFVRNLRREPFLHSADPSEKRLAEALAYIRAIKANSKNE